MYQNLNYNNLLLVIDNNKEYYVPKSKKNLPKYIFFRNSEGIHYITDGDVYRGENGLILVENDTVFIPIYQYLDSETNDDGQQYDIATHPIFFKNENTVSFYKEKNGDSIQFLDISNVFSRHESDWKEFYPSIK